MTCLLAVVFAGSSQVIDVGGSREATPTTIVFAGNVNADEEPALRRLLTQFEESTRARVDLGLASRFRYESGIKVKLIATNDTERLEMLRSGDPGFHLFAEDIVGLRPLVDEDLVQAPPTGVLPGSVYPRLVEVLHFGDEQLFFLPFRLNVRLMYARTAKLQDAGQVAPRSLEQFKTVARRLKEENDGKPAVTLSLSKDDGGGPAAVTMSELILGQGGDPKVLNSDASVRAFQFLRECWQEGLLRDESLFGKHDTEVGHLKEKDVAALAQNWAFTSSELEKSGDLDDFDVHPGWQGSRAHVIGGDALGIPRVVRGNEKEAAIELAQYLMSDTAQRFLAAEISWPSIKRKINDEQRSETFRAMAEALEEGWYRPTDRYWADAQREGERDSPKRMDMTRAMNQAVERVLRGTEPVKQILDGLHERIRADYPDAYPPKG